MLWSDQVETLALQQCSFMSISFRGNTASLPQIYTHRTHLLLLSAADQRFIPVLRHCNDQHLVAPTAFAVVVHWGDHFAS